MKIVAKHQKSKTAQIIMELMKAANITEAELARQTGLPQTTINRLLLGNTIDPRSSTLKPIAEFFCVSVDQLLGLQSIYTEQQGLTKHHQREAWHSIPVITWEIVNAWAFQKKKLSPLNHEQWVVTEQHVSSSSFALVSLAYMEPIFRQGSILIIDPEGEITHHSYVIITLNDSTQATIRRISYDGSALYIEGLFNPKELIPLTNQYKIHGVVVETRIQYINIKEQ